MDDIIYTFCGYQYGSFTLENSGELVKYCNIYVISPMEGKEQKDRRFGGYKAEKLKCTSPDVFEGIKPQDKVKLVFNRYGRVSGVSAVK